MYTHEDLKRNKRELDEAYAQLNAYKSQIHRAHNPGILGSIFSSKKDRMRKTHKKGFFFPCTTQRRDAAWQKVKRLKAQRENMKAYLFKK